MSIWSRLKNIIGKKEGFTLVELIVTLAITAIFLASTGMVVAQTYKFYGRERSLGEGMEVADMLLDKVQSELECARYNAAADPNKDEKNTGYLKFVSGDKGICQIEYCDFAGAERIIGVGQRAETANGIKYNLLDSSVGDQHDCFLVVRYKTLSSKVNGSNVENVTYYQTDSVYSPEAYMGFEVKDLHFENSGNIIKAYLTIRNSLDVEFTEERYIRCYNFPG